jgi:hypothetical protein
MSDSGGRGSYEGTGVPNPKQYNIVRDTTICNKICYNKYVNSIICSFDKTIIEKAASQYEFTTGVMKLENVGVEKNNSVF